MANYLGCLAQYVWNSVRHVSLQQRVSSEYVLGIWLTQTVI